MHRARWPALSGALLLSGCAALVYQVVWFRMCNRAFGATAPAVATVLAVFMAGLGLGAHFAGRRADEYAPRRCLEAYALLELGIAGLALLTPWLLGALPDVHAFAARHAGHGAFVGTLIRVIASAGALLPPTLLMGATLPLLLRGSEPAPEGLSRSIGRLYTANNLGAVLGTLLSGFVLLRELGETRTVQCAVVLNLAAAGLALLGRSRAPAQGAAPRPKPARATGPRAELALLCGAAGTGLVIVGFEVIWSRTLTPLLGSTVYAFSAMLAAVLVGLALGSALATRFGDRAPSPQLAFAGLGMLSAVAALATQRLTPELIVPAIGLLEVSQDVTWRLAGVPFVLSLALVVLPTLLSGAALPLGIRALAQHNPAATSTGMLYAANTLGSITGALATGLVLIPSIGTARTSAVVALAGASLCTFAAWRVAPRQSAPVVWLPLAGALALAATQPAFDVLLFAGGLHMMGTANRELLVRHGIQTRLAGSEVLYVAEGKSTTVLVERRWGRRVFFVDGKPEATDGAEDMRNQYLLAHIPALLHGHVRRSLVVGLGSGMTAGCLTLHGDVHVAELSDIVPGAARMFADLNHDVVRNPRARIFIEDGRTFLEARDETYDVITVDPIHPYVAGAATLYTREYFAAVRSRLREGGIASHWLPLYQLGWDDVAGVLEAFRQTFPDAVVYNTDRDAILVGNAGARLPSAARVAHGFELPGVRADLARVRIETAEQFAALASVGPAGLRRLTRGARPVTDDHTFIEFTAPRWFQHPTHDNLRRILALREPSASGASDAERSARAIYVAQLELVAAPGR